MLNWWPITYNYWVRKFFLNFRGNRIYLFKKYTDLEWQSNEKATAKLDNELFDSSVLETLYYSCAMFKWGTAANEQSSSRYNPYKLAEHHKVAPMQFEWIALNERGRSQSWRDVETIFEKKVFLLRFL